MLLVGTSTEFSGLIDIVEAELFKRYFQLEVSRGLNSLEKLQICVQIHCTIHSAFISYPVFQKYQ